MAKRPKYHFLTIVQSTPRGRSVVTLPGQTFGQIPVPGNVLVKDSRGSTAVSRTRKGGTTGAIYFTTTLRMRGLTPVASDVLPLIGHGNVIYADAEDRYAEYLEGREEKR